MTGHSSRRAALTPLRPQSDWHTCEACGKRAYHSRAAAKAARVSVGDSSLHLYRCEAGELHLGHMAPGRTRDVYRARRRRQARGDTT